MRSLGYTPNPHAQSLKRNDLEKSSRSFHSSIAYSCSEQFLQGSHHDWEMLSLIEKEILASHYSVSAPRADLPAAEEKVRDLGLVLVGAESERRIAQYIEKYKNVVCISEHHTGQPCDLVLLDMRKSLLRAWEYLSELGHRRIAFAGAEKGDFFRTYTDVIPADAGAQFIPCGLSMSDGMLLAGELCDCLMVPSALVCENNSIACGAIQALRERRLAVPRGRVGGQPGRRAGPVPRGAAGERDGVLLQQGGDQPPGGGPADRPHPPAAPARRDL